MSRIKNKRMWWIGLAVIAAMLVVIPTAMAQGPVVEPAGTNAPAWHSGPDADDGYYRLEFGIESPDCGFAGDPCGVTAWGLRNQLVAGGWGGPSSYIWLKANAWEQDWKHANFGGTNDSWADNVDLAFYVGHGSPGSFTFNGLHDDYWLTYQDARLAWGNRDAEWVGLLSCSVLADSHRNDWAWTMDGLHLLMGFKTAASAGYPGFGNTLGWRLRLNDTVAGAWMYACDTQQGTSNYARILAESPQYWSERPYSTRMLDTWDNYYQYWDHQCGSEYPRAAAPLAGNAMPVFLTPPLSLAEAASEWGSLTNAFALPVQSTGIMASGTMSGTETGGRELTMDTDSGLFYFVDHNNLFTATAQLMSAQAVNITPGQAQAIATYFLTSTGLMPADAQFYEVATNGVTEVMSPGRATGIQSGPEQLSPMATTDYSVIFSRIVTYSTTTATGVQAVEEYSVGGPGAKMKVYVNPAGAAAKGASIAAAAATDVIGAQGGWRRVDNEPAVPGVQAVSAVTETILDYPVIVQLFEQLEKQVALAATVLPNPTSRTILSSTVFFWEEATGTGQDQLFPAYDLVVEYAGLQAGELVTFTDHSYIPAAPEYMRPYAEIVASNTMGRNFTFGQVLTATAADAALQLSALGYPGLNFVLGSGDVTYQWYILRQGEKTPIGTPNSRFLSWTVAPAALDLGKALPAGQTLLLEVTDNGTSHASQSLSSYSIPFNVMPPIYLPMVSKG